MNPRATKILLISDTGHTKISYFFEIWLLVCEGRKIYTKKIGKIYLCKIKLGFKSRFQLYDQLIILFLIIHKINKYKLYL